MGISTVLKNGTSYLEKLLLRLGPREPQCPPLFIVGAPRCGTTIVSLHLANTFEFSYFPNISKRNPQFPLMAAALGSLVWKYTPTTDTSYGQVDGPMAPSDGWQIFHRWFPRYDHSEPVDTESLPELRSIVAGLEALMGGPFLNKNNNNSTRIRELSQLFPRSLFVHVRRNPRDAVASLIRAREEHNVPPDGWWSAAPPQCYDTAPPDTVERSVLQICKVDQYIEDVLYPDFSDRCYEVSYESFCSSPKYLEDWILSNYEKLGVKIGNNKTESMEYEVRSSLKKISNKRRLKVKKLINKYSQS